MKRYFLKTLIDNGGKWGWTLHGLDRQLNQKREIVVHIAHLLEGENKIAVRGQEIPAEMIYEITSLGRQEFDTWYHKAWRFFTNDFAKILSVISLMLSIIASLIAWFK